MLVGTIASIRLALLNDSRHEDLDLKLDGLTVVFETGIISNKQKQAFFRDLFAVIEEAHLQNKTVDGIKPRCDAIALRQLWALAPPSITRSLSGDARALAQASLPKAELSPSELAEKLGLRLAVKSKARAPAVNSDDMRAQSRISHLQVEGRPGEVYAVSHTFRRGSFNKLRLAKDPAGKFGVFTVAHIAQGCATAPRKVYAQQLTDFVQARASLEAVASPLVTSKGTDVRLVDQKGRVYSWQPLFSQDLLCLSNELRLLPGSPAAFLHVMVQMAQDLQTSHKRGFMLLDVKPENFLYSPSHPVIFGDHGFSSPVHSQRRGRTTGTWGYMAPEMMRAEGPAIGAESDTFSLGLTWIAMITGARLPELDLDKPALLELNARLDKLAAFRAAGKPTNESDAKGLPKDAAGSWLQLKAKLGEPLASFVFDEMLQADPNKRPNDDLIISTLKMHQMAQRTSPNSVAKLLRAADRNAEAAQPARKQIDVLVEVLDMGERLAQSLEEEKQ